MEIKHGTRTGYNKCVARPEGSCEACKEAARVYEAERAARKAAENAESLAERKTQTTCRSLTGTHHAKNPLCTIRVIQPEGPCKKTRSRAKQVNGNPL